MRRGLFFCLFRAVVCHFDFVRFLLVFFFFGVGVRGVVFVIVHTLYVLFLTMVINQVFHWQ